MESQTETINDIIASDKLLNLLCNSVNLPIVILKTDINKIILNNALLKLIGYETDVNKIFDINQIVLNYDEVNSTINNIINKSFEETKIPIDFYSNSGNPVRVYATLFLNNEEENIIALLTNNNLNDSSIENNILSTIEKQLSLKSKELNNEEERFNRILENLPFLIIAFDEDNKLLYVNSKFEKYLGYSLLDLSQTGFDSKVFSDDQEKYYNFINESNKDKSISLRLIEKSGNSLQVVIRKEFFEINEKIKIKLLIIDFENYTKSDYIENQHNLTNEKDITQEQNKTEKSTDISLNDLLFDNYPDIIVIHDFSGLIVETNNLFIEKLGYDKKEVLGKNISDYGIFLNQEIIKDISNDTKSKLKLVHHLKTKSGDTFDVKSDLRIIDHKNNNLIMNVLKETSPTKQKLVENRILEGSLGQLLNFMNIGIIIFNHEGYLTHISSNCETLTGINGNEWNEASPFLVDKIAREDFIIFRQNIERVFAGEFLRDILIVFKNSEDKKTELKGSFLPVLNEDGVVSEVMLVLQNYSESDKEKKLNNFYELILDNAPIGIITFDPNGNYTSVNEEFLKMLGYEFSREEVLKWNLYSLMDKDKILPGFITALKGEVVDYTRDYMPTPSNQKFSFYQSFAPLKDKNGNIIGVLGLLNEITDKSIIPQNIIEAEEKYHKIFESLDECVLLFKATGKIINANRGAFILLDEQIENIISKDITEYFADKENEEFEDFMFNLHSFGYAKITTKIKKSDNTTFEAEVYGKGVEISGIQHFFIVIKKHRIPSQDELPNLSILDYNPDKQTSELIKGTNGIDSYNFLKEFDEGIIITDSFIQETIFINEKIKEMYNVTIDDFYLKDISSILTQGMDENSKYFFQKNIELCRSSQLGIKPFEVDYINRDENSRHFKVEIFNFTSKILGKELKYIKFTPHKPIKFIEDEAESIKGRYYKYFEYLPIPCVIINSEGIILDLNPPFNEALQYSYSEIINRNFADLFFEDKERVSDFIKLHKSFHHLNEQSNLKIKKRDNTIVDCRIFYTKIEDNIFLVFLHINNIQKYLSANFEEKDFDNRLSAIQNLTGEICMGFSSFIYLIDGYTEFLSKSRELSHKEKQRLNQLLLLIEKIHNFVEKLLVFSQKKYLEQEEFDIIPILRESAKNIFSNIQQKYINIQDSSIIVRSNRTAVKNMFDDIFNFIISSIGDVGKIELISSVDSHPIDLNDLGIAGFDQFLLITIKEKGFKIPNDILLRIFEPFVTSKDLNKCDIGLSFSYGVIKSLGGTISIEEDELFDHKMTIVIPFNKS